MHNVLHNKMTYKLKLLRWHFFSTRCQGGRMQYCIDWKWYGTEMRCWVPVQNVLDHTHIREFHPQCLVHSAAHPTGRPCKFSPSTWSIYPFTIFSDFWLLICSFTIGCTQSHFISSFLRKSRFMWHFLVILCVLFIRFGFCFVWLSPLSLPSLVCLLITCPFSCITSLLLVWALVFPPWPWFLVIFCGDKFIFLCWRINSFFFPFAMANGVSFVVLEKEMVVFEISLKDLKLRHLYEHWVWTPFRMLFLYFTVGLLDLGKCLCTALF